MSHFTVMIMGENVEKQLAPFHEFECTGTNDQYVQDEDVTDELKARIEDGESVEDALSYYGLEDKTVDDESKVDKEGDDCEHKYGYAIVKDGQLIKAVNRTNPNRKWDWYQIGGRWSGFLKLKPGAEGESGERSWMMRGQPVDATRADSALKSAIDIDAMRDEAGQAAGEQWDKAHEIINDRSFRTWEQCKQDCANSEGQTDYEKAREVYNAQPAVIDFRKSDSFGFFASPDEFLIPRDKFVQTARDAAFTTFAIIKDGEWYEKGEMGWWGMVADEKAQDDWNKQFANLIDGLSDDTRITIVDCHI